ncbi:hypothetical protein ACIF8T_40170 [Streptomyces sp. NPDC085946]
MDTAGADEQRLRDLATEDLGEVDFCGLDVQFTDVEHIESEL